MEETAKPSGQVEKFSVGFNVETSVVGGAVVANLSVGTDSSLLRHVHDFVSLFASMERKSKQRSSHTLGHSCSRSPRKKDRKSATMMLVVCVT